MDYPKLTAEQDNRRKIPVSEHEYIQKRYREGESQRQIARAYGVSRRLIVFILYPERLVARMESVKRNKSWLKYYDKDKQREYMRTYRLHKKEVGQKNAINEWEKVTKKERGWSNGKSGECPKCGKYYKYLTGHARLVCKIK